MFAPKMLFCSSACKGSRNMLENYDYLFVVHGSIDPEDGGEEVPAEVYLGVKGCPGDDLDSIAWIIAIKPTENGSSDNLELMRYLNRLLGGGIEPWCMPAKEGWIIYPQDGYDDHRFPRLKLAGCAAVKLRKTSANKPADSP